MYVVRNSLDIIFRKMSPEFVKDGLLSGLEKFKKLPVTVYGFNLDAFCRFSHQSFSNLSQDEVENVYDFMIQKMGKNRESKDKSTIFHLLTDFTNDILEVSYGDPVCEKEHILKWRDTSFYLGQDIFTTAHLAFQDARIGKQRTYFGWPAIIRSNDPRIRELMKQGMAENHYHLYGSVPVFQLTWLSLMNHPQDCGRFEKEQKVIRKFHDNLDPSFMQNHKDYQMPWSERIRLAAWIRAKLFLHVMDMNAKSMRKQYEAADSQQAYEAKQRKPERILEEMEEFLADHGNQNRKVCHLAEQARFLYGKKVQLSNGRMKYLDYAYTSLLDDDHNEGYHRLLVGERYFLYSCFYICFSDNCRFTENEMNLFYLYLLLKNHLRNELIQVNQRVGFRNFAEYQDRKTILWEKYREYWGEAYRMAINGAIRDNRLDSLEVRIMPEDKKENYMNHIFQIDREAFFAREYYPGDRDCYPTPEKKKVLTSGKKAEYFYVIHFPKRRLGKATREKAVMGLITPRNADVRRRTQRQAFALVKALMDHNYLCMRIRGIDGCSAEIGCRPETFATEFRFLRNFVSVAVARRPWKYESDIKPLLSATYHVGEDFLEIADGLRAIDEAVNFLDLRRGDRLGHALALGIDPDPYYRMKEKSFVLSKQDRLDDLVWLLFRSRELKVSLPADLEAEIMCEAKSLLNQIYGNCLREHGCQEDLQYYYESWKLRGDHPSLYRGSDFSEMGEPIEIECLAGKYSSIRNQYEMFKKNKKITVVLNECNRVLAFYYQFGFEERKKGQEMVSVKTKREYIDLIKRMQEGMVRELARKGISIECNPSSNVLIGTFDRYEEHPIFRFNKSSLSDGYGFDKNLYGSSWDELCVSVNTDDQGIFDTSLENEYTLLARTLEKQKKEDGTHRYSPYAIWNYLNYLRSMGEMQVFPKAFQSEEEAWDEKAEEFIDG